MLFAYSGARSFADSQDQKQDPSVVRVACIGDSITFGAGIPDPTTQSYPAVLGNWLGAGYKVANFGVSGTTLLQGGDFPYLSTPAYRKSQAFKPNIVVIMLGTNDTKSQNWKYCSQFVSDYRSLIQQFATLPSKPKIYVCLPCPVFGNGNYGINEPNLLIELPMIDEVVQEEHIAVIDVYSALQGRVDLFPDDVHPNAAGAQLIARAVYLAITGKELPPVTEQESPVLP